MLPGEVSPDVRGQAKKQVVAERRDAIEGRRRFGRGCGPEQTGRGRASQPRGPPRPPRGPPWQARTPPWQALLLWRAGQGCFLTNGGDQVPSNIDGGFSEGQ